MPTPEPAAFYAPIPPLDEWPLSRMAASLDARRGRLERRRARPKLPRRRFASPAFDRVQLTAWAMLRGPQAPCRRPRSATGGTLGGSQAGARLDL